MIQLRSHLSPVARGEEKQSVATRPRKDLPVSLELLVKPPGPTCDGVWSGGSLQLVDVNEAWVITSYEAAHEVACDDGETWTKVFYAAGDRGAAVEIHGGGSSQNIFFTDPHEGHYSTQHARLIPQLSPALCYKLREKVIRRVVDRTDRFRSLGRAELFAALASPVPLRWMTVVPGRRGVDGRVCPPHRRRDKLAGASAGQTQHDGRSCGAQAGARRVRPAAPSGLRTAGSWRRRPRERALARCRRDRRPRMDNQRGGRQRTHPHTGRLGFNGERHLQRAVRPPHPTGDRETPSD